ncbi:GL25007 [Drosophila persimilis]|uniref:GL25007 n=1 Tax=Drosophila persimilis TaxID=7234 RepID=B4GU86_DROPE|nr:GL25007 [Drosophila persimilis]
MRANRAPPSPRQQAEDNAGQNKDHDNPVLAQGYDGNASVSASASASANANANEAGDLRHNQRHSASCKLKLQAGTAANVDLCEAEQEKRDWAFFVAVQEMSCIKPHSSPDHAQADPNQRRLEYGFEM